MIIPISSDIWHGFWQFGNKLNKPNQIHGSFAGIPVSNSSLPFAGSIDSLTRVIVLSTQTMNHYFHYGQITQIVSFPQYRWVCDPSWKSWFPKEIYWNPGFHFQVSYLNFRGCKDPNVCKKRVLVYIYKINLYNPHSAGWHIWWNWDRRSNSSRGFGFLGNVHNWATKNPLIFHCNAWLIGILLLAYYNPYITG